MFHTSNYELEGALPKWKNKNLIGLIKDEVVGKIMTVFVGLRAKTYSYLIDDGSKNKKAKGTKRCVLKAKLKLENYENCLRTTQHESKINHLVRNEIDSDTL